MSLGVVARKLRDYYIVLHQDGALYDELHSFGAKSLADSGLEPYFYDIYIFQNPAQSLYMFKGEYGRVCPDTKIPEVIAGFHCKNLN